MFESGQLREVVNAAGGQVVAMSASNWASLGDPAVLEPIERNQERWRHFMKNEVSACAEPGAVDGGTHILFAARKPEPDRPSWLQLLSELGVPGRGSLIGMQVCVRRFQP